MVKEFEVINGLVDLVKILNLDSENKEHLCHLVGVTSLDSSPKDVLDAFVKSELVESRSKFFKSPTSLWINSQKVNPTDVWNFEKMTVLCLGKHRNSARVLILDSMQMVKQGFCKSPLLGV